MLVVITIIGMLVALVSFGVVRALDAAKQTRIKVEVDGIDAAFKAYKSQYGSYPPCNLTNPASNTALRSHIARIFPRYTGNLANDLPLAGIDTTNFRPDQALVFWLQGFSPDVTNPFVTPAGFQITAGAASGTVKPTRTPLFSFDPTRLWQVPSATGGSLSAVISPSSTVSSPPLASYFPQGSIPPLATAAPYLYWDAGVTTVTTTGGSTTVTSNYGNLSPAFHGNVLPTAERFPVAFNLTASSTPPTIQIFQSAGVAVPYWNDSGPNPGLMEPTENFVNPDSFQIISAGMDGMYGNFAGTTVRLFPTGTNYDATMTLADDDNVTNFNAKARLADAKP